MDEREPLSEVVKALRHDAGRLFHGESRYLLIRPGPSSRSRSRSSSDSVTAPPSTSWPPDGRAAARR